MSTNTKLILLLMNGLELTTETLEILIKANDISPVALTELNKIIAVNNQLLELARDSNSMEEAT